VRPNDSARNALATPVNVDVDLRVLKMVRSGHLDVVAESFNLLNHRNVSPAQCGVRFGQCSVIGLQRTYRDIESAADSVLSGLRVLTILLDGTGCEVNNESISFMSKGQRFTG
jgi:hypothetical protein